MARNKHPEVTVEKILQVAKRLFLEKGYDATTIQDIVDGLGGLTKGAVYHHFKNKEEIMHALGDRMFFDNDPFAGVWQRSDLNGLEKMREVLRQNRADTQRTRLNIQAMPLLQNPHMLAAALAANQRVLAPRWRRLLKEGQRDGSIPTEYPEELAQLLPLVNFWLMPTLYPADSEALARKLRFVGQALESMGLPLLDDDMMAEALRVFAGEENPAP